MPIPAQANAPYLGFPYSSTPVSVKEKPCLYSKRQFAPRDHVPPLRMSFTDHVRLACGEAIHFWRAKRAVR